MSEPGRADAGPQDAAQAPEQALAGAGTLVERFVERLGDREPDEATRIGLAGHDDRLPDLSPESVAAWARELTVLRAEVDAHLTAVGDATVGVAAEARGDLELLADELDRRLFWLETRPRLELDPLAALDTVAAGLHELLHALGTGVGSDRARLESALARARQVPQLLEQAGRTLTRAPAPHLDVALRRIPGLVELVRDALPRTARELGIDVVAAEDAGAVAVEGLEAYAALLDELASAQGHAGHDADWRLGPDAHRMMLRAALGTEMDTAEIERRAHRRLERIRDELDELAGRMWGQWLPGAPRPDEAGARIRGVMDAVAATALDRDELVPAAASAVDEARDFAVAAGLVDVPPAERLRITEVPVYLQGVAVAFVTEPPALAPEVGSTYYVSPVPASWDADRAASFLREYNPSQLRSLAVHEAYPGHFVQLAHAAEHPRLVRRLLGRSAFAEGWAVYVERQAVRLGFGDDAYRLVQRKLELRIAVNALLDVGLHTGELDDDAALALLTDRAFQEPAEAEGKLVRAKVTSGQLCSYFVGGAELTRLRERAERAAGADFDGRDFHQRLLSHGTPTIDIVARALADPTAAARRPFA